MSFRPGTSGGPVSLVLVALTDLWYIVLFGQRSFVSRPKQTVSIVRWFIATVDDTATTTTNIVAAVAELDSQRYATGPTRWTKVNF